MSNYIIAGIDPGSTIGIAILDLRGRKIGTYSFSGGLSEAVKTIERHGTPSIIACDVTPVPDMVARAASFFSCKLYTPQRNIREEDKRKVASGAGTQNAHERDAYTAAVYAYRASANRLRQIDALGEVPQEDKERVKHLMLKGYKLQDAFVSLKAPVAEVEKPQAIKVAVEQKLSPEDLKGRISALARENANLRLTLERLEEEKAALMHRLRLFENGVRQNIARDMEVRRLRFQLQKYAERLMHYEKWKQKRGKPAQKAPHETKQEEKAAAAPATAEGQSLKTDYQPRMHKHSMSDAFCQGQNAHARSCKERGDLQLQLNRLIDPNLDLEKIVEEYRKGRGRLK